MKWKTYYWLVSLVLIGTFLLIGCSSSGDGDGTTTEAPTLTDYATGPMSSVPAVKADGSKTVLPATADTHIVKTDGNWIVWNGRTINLGYFNGDTLEYLNTGLPGSVTPWAFGDHADAPVGFDGATVVFVGRDVATGVAKFYYMTPGSTAKSIALPPSIQDTSMYDFIAYVSGTLAVVASDSAQELYRADLSDASPAFEELLISNEPRGAIGKYLAVVNDGFVEIYDMTGAVDQTPTILTGDDDGSTWPGDFRQANGFFTWIESGLAYYFEPGEDANSSAVYAAGSGQTDPVAGPDYFLWEEGGSLWYMAQGGDTPEEVGYYIGAEYLEAGNGFFAYVDQDGDGYDQIFVYDLADLTAVEGVQVSENGEGAEAVDESDEYFQVDGNWVYNVFEYKDMHNPSRVAVAYNFATDTLKEAGEGAFQQVAIPKIAGGKAVLLCRDHSFRLLAKKAGVAGKPVVLTPINMMVQEDGQFSVEDGIVAFKALDRNRYLNNSELWEQVIDGVIQGHDLSEIYYIDLDAAGSIVRVTNNRIEEEENIQFDGRFITWSDDTDDDSSAWGYDIVSKKLTDMGPADEVKVAVDNGIAVWEAYNGDLGHDDVHYYDLNTGTGAFLGSDGVDNCPNIAGGLITWEDQDHPYYYDLNAAEPEIVNIYEEMPAYVDNIWGPVRTDGRFLVWEEYRNGWDPGTGAITTEVIVFHDTGNGTTNIVPAADYTMIDSLCYPRISNGVVFFGAEGYGVENSDGDKELFLYDLNATTPTLVRLTNDAENEGLWDSRSEMAAGLMVWRTGGASSWNWKGKVVAAAYVD